MADYKMELHLGGLAWRKKNRSHFEIMASMLEAVKNNGRVRYSIMKHMGTSSAQLKKYLDSLTEIGFIETNLKGGQVLYRASEEGLDFLRQYYVLLGILLSARACGNTVSPKRVSTQLTI